MSCVLLYVDNKIQFKIECQTSIIANRGRGRWMDDLILKMALLKVELTSGSLRTCFHLPQQNGGTPHKVLCTCIPSWRTVSLVPSPYLLGFYLLLLYLSNSCLKCPYRSTSNITPWPQKVEMKEAMSTTSGFGPFVLN